MDVKVEWFPWYRKRIPNQTKPNGKVPTVDTGYTSGGSAVKVTGEGEDVVCGGGKKTHCNFHL